MYLDIIRRHRRGEQDGTSSATEPQAGSSRDAAGVPGSVRATIEGPETPSTLGAANVLAEIGRPGSGPARALETYREKPNVERLGWLTKAILHARGMGTARWERYVLVVEEAARNAVEEPSERKEA